ncbi:type II toxin-antitoxin system RelE/ParE family toxin [Candidatus Enterococcus ferrettii]|uniref:Type II toxin-antitoxin system YafQ family toxin n=1 Tax=Candidatus Enterococcus ferrettii TaxID=2815324 RepID=A0ABV0EMC7_9ENTE|nr:type II toxin-antitoxin system YafQ family toxin [Enterococcus sp. 665A]MBO1338220.1 type II toxin-antitoxin system YafQ family toxin [Enterococcus sp. 665A]
MLNYRTTKRFDKDLKKLIKQGRPVEKLKTAMDLLVNETELKQEYRLHPLEPKSKVPKRWDIHTDGRNSDWVLIFYYVFEQNTIIFERTGSHSDLFK